ncbi:MAG: HTH domain-containing protein [Elusimicrobiales bacterium]|nr:HTH domain-containing protein [Elusimicrobiales bacterium]
MNKRMVSIIQELSNLEKKIGIADLAAKYEVSQRTVRNDINAINDMLKAHKLIELKLEKGGKIIRDRSFHEILHYIDDKDFYDYKLSKEERKKIAAVLLINSSGFITLLDIAEHMSVSRATVISDLDEIKAYIKKGNLGVLSHANKGLRVEGKESDKRIFLMKLVSFNPESEEQDVVGKQIAIDYGIKDVLGKILYEQEHVYESFLNDHSFQKMLAYLIIMTNRIQQGEYIETREKKKNSKYEMAESILKYVGQYCHMIVTEDEVFFLSELLSFGRYIKQKKSDKLFQTI